MFAVVIPIGEGDEKGLTAVMAAMRQWLDHHGVQPSTFRYTFTASGMLLQIDFSVEADAHAFAGEFGGRMAEAQADMSLQEVP